ILETRAAGNTICRLQTHTVNEDHLLIEELKSRRLIVDVRSIPEGVYVAIQQLRHSRRACRSDHECSGGTTGLRHNKVSMREDAWIDDRDRNVVAGSELLVVSCKSEHVR